MEKKEIQINVQGEFEGTTDDLAFHIAATVIEPIMDKTQAINDAEFYAFSAALLYAVRSMIKIRLPENIENDILDHVERSLINADQEINKTETHNFS